MEYRGDLKEDLGNFCLVVILLIWVSLMFLKCSDGIGIDLLFKRGGLEKDKWVIDFRKDLEFMV